MIFTIYNVHHKTSTITTNGNNKCSLHGHHNGYKVHFSGSDATSSHYKMVSTFLDVVRMLEVGCRCSLEYMSSVNFVLNFRSILRFQSSTTNSTVFARWLGQPVDLCLYTNMHSSNLHNYGMLQSANHHT